MEILGLSTTTVLGSLGVLSLLVNIIVELTKGIVPKKIPTSLIVILVSMVVCIFFALVFFEFTIKSLLLGFFMSFIVSYTSMNGFDKFLELQKRFVLTEKKSD